MNEKGVLSAAASPNHNHSSHAINLNSYKKLIRSVLIVFLFSASTAILFYITGGHHEAASFISQSLPLNYANKELNFRAIFNGRFLPLITSSWRSRIEDSHSLISWVTHVKHKFVQQIVYETKRIILRYLQSNGQSSKNTTDSQKTDSSSSGKGSRSKEKKLLGIESYISSYHKNSLTGTKPVTSFYTENRVGIICLPPKFRSKLFRYAKVQIGVETCENDFPSLIQPVSGMILGLRPLGEETFTSTEHPHKIVRYELVERLHHELGMVDNHSTDFAYRPAHSFFGEHRYNQQKKQKQENYERSDKSSKGEQLVSIDSNKGYASSANYQWISSAAKNLWIRKGFYGESQKEILLQLDQKHERIEDKDTIQEQRIGNILQLEQKYKSKEEAYNTYIEERNIFPYDRTSINNYKIFASSGIEFLKELYEANPFFATKVKEASEAPALLSPLNRQGFENESIDYTKMGERAFAGGAQGEVWRARRKCPPQNHDIQCDDKQELIMKRLKVEQGQQFLEAGLREVYFGNLLAQHKNSSFLFTTYIDHFFREQSVASAIELELWIVFEYAGPSLRSYLYTPVSSGGFVIYEHSAFWRELRMGVHQSERRKSTSPITTLSSYHEHNNAKTNHGVHIDTVGGEVLFKNLGGRELMKEVLRQLLTSAAFLHKQGIIHRDIKPSNIMCNILKHNDSVNCVLGDLSSAWEKDISETMYMNGPSAAEQTDEYAPPEVLFGPQWIPFDEHVPSSYDSWSIGVVALEMLLGTPYVFSVDQRTTTILSYRLKKEGAHPEDIRRALYLAGLSQFCIYIPATNDDKKWPLRDGDPLHNTAIVKPTCTIQDFHSALRARDPLGLGFDSSSDPLLHLIWGLLAWDPAQRISPEQALDHHYFNAYARWNYDDDNRTVNKDFNHALTPQLLDPDISAKVDRHQTTEFVCPKCGKIFHDWNSCYLHARKRKHAKFCNFDRTNLPPCLNAHSMLPAHPTSGYCDIQGRRPTIEDFHSIHLHPSHQFYGVFDGHWGNLASKYSSRYMYASLEKLWTDLDERVRSDTHWKGTVEKDLHEAFRKVHEGFLKAVAKSPGRVMNKSGTTATILLSTEEAIIVANVGDSRAIMSKGASFFPNSMKPSAIQLTVDHIASNIDERRRIERVGGYISSSGSVDRVNGTLAVTRSIGDVPMMGILSQSPNVWAKTKKDVQTQCKQHTDDTVHNEGSNLQLQNENIGTPDMPCFAVLASDGLWDVMSNQEVIEMVIEVLRQYHFDGGEISWEEGGGFQLAAQQLTQEAYVRGSTDNIGVCVVAIS